MLNSLIVEQQILGAIDYLQRSCVKRTVPSEEVVLNTAAPQDQAPMK